MELEPSNPEPVQPSSQPGARVSASIAKTTDLAGQLAHALRVIDGLLDAMGTHAASLDTFRTDMRQCAMLDRQENNYIARRRPKAPMGS